MKKNKLIKQLLLGGLILATASSSVIAFIGSQSPEQESLQDKIVTRTIITTEKSITGSIQESRSRSNLDVYNETVESFRKDVLSDNEQGRENKKLMSSDYSSKTKQHVNNKGANYNIKTISRSYQKQSRLPVNKLAVKNNNPQYYEKSPVIADQSASKTKLINIKEENSEESVSNKTLQVRNMSFAGKKYHEIKSNSDVSQTIQSEDTNAVSSNPAQKNEIAQNYSVSIERDLVLGSINEGIMNLVLSIYVDSSTPNGLIIKETIPEGWDVVESTVPYDNYNPDNGEIKWLLIGSDIKNTTISYRIVKNDLSEGGSQFYGKYLYKDAEGKDVDIQIYYANGV